jgi:hypothetical protein
MLEILAPAARAAATREPFSPALRRNRALEIARVRDEITTLFAPELAVAPSPGREVLQDALVMAATYGSWAVLRDQLSLDVDAACAVMTRTVAALLNS